MDVLRCRCPLKLKTLPLWRQGATSEPPEASKEWILRGDRGRGRTRFAASGRLSADPSGSKSRLSITSSRDRVASQSAAICAIPHIETVGVAQGSSMLASLPRRTLAVPRLRLGQSASHLPGWHQSSPGRSILCRSSGHSIDA